MHLLAWRVCSGVVVLQIMLGRVSAVVREGRTIVDIKMAEEGKEKICMIVIVVIVGRNN